MKVAQKNIVIAESSYLLRKGLLSAVAQLPFAGTITELDTQRSLPIQIDTENPDIIIINPLLLGSAITIRTPREILKIEKDIPVVALVYNLFDANALQNFDTIISITDSLDVITDKLQKIVNAMDESGDDNEDLSDREKEILVAVVTGLLNKEIADQFNLSIHTVIAHRRNITRKLGIHSVAGLTVYAILNKLVDLNDLKVI
ncbi:MAG TPA: response regulator transcription factor [Dysgonamonadaceae bacterium]|nr:response regulator transcription factor [Dysgonamonadaceae bacterium]